ncbi:MAG: hypothetical protein E7Z70_06805 [Thermoplasmata archaeon]|nr:hypothetical protein [Thermoplasmata archaeon]WII06797.1 hypothetical protein PED39_04220 [Methanomassiliicoccales archaeon LGM-RCC1]
MAKKKRRILEEPEEEYEFTPTEFNEREFILKEIYISKIFAVSMVLAVVIGIIDAILIKTWPMESGGYYLMSIPATILAFFGIFLTKKISSVLGLHPELIEVKSLAGTYLMYLAMALGICIVGVQF